MAELGYAQRLGRCLERVRGSNPLGGTSHEIHPYGGFCDFYAGGFEREGGRGNGSFPVAEILKPLGFRERSDVQLLLGGTDKNE